MARKPIKKSVRFEVFKRDSFTCQYCGRQAPEAVLHIDHIDPIAKGGTNDILNLITACDSCNMGKGVRELSDDSVIMKQKGQLDELNERREQLEMMLQWKEGMSEIREMEIDIIDTILSDLANHSLTDSGRQTIKRLISKYGFDEVEESMVIACEKKPLPTNLVDYCERVCRVRNSKNKNLYYINYLRKVIQSEIGIDNPKRVNIFLNSEVDSEQSFEEIKKIIKKSRGWYDMWARIREIYGEY